MLELVRLVIEYYGVFYFLDKDKRGVFKTSLQVSITFMARC